MPPPNKDAVQSNQFKHRCWLGMSAKAKEANFERNDAANWQPNVKAARIKSKFVESGQ
jgi:hypothetical protein